MTTAVRRLEFDINVSDVTDIEDEIVRIVHQAGVKKGIHFTYDVGTFTPSEGLVGMWNTSVIVTFEVEI